VGSRSRMIGGLALRDSLAVSAREGGTHEARGEGWWTRADNGANSLGEKSSDRPAVSER
jgi:hypothetical protein